MKEVDPAFNIGFTPQLSLRVSVANLVKVTFIHPEDQQKKLVLERTGTVIADHGSYIVRVIAKPFGGGVRILNPERLRIEVGDFNFDSLRTREENDFRIFINPKHWNRLKQFCWVHLITQGEILESSPRRELVEEFHDALNYELFPDQYHLEWSKLVVEAKPARTGSPRSMGSLTSRIYSVHKMQILDLQLIKDLIENSTNKSDQDLREVAEEDYLEGGRGRANAALVLDYAQLNSAYKNLSEADQGEPAHLFGHDFDGNTLAVLDEVESKKYSRLSCDDIDHAWS
ncbi:MAG: hypothetical protein ACWGOY_11100 [Anaerolineales bacterium]